VHAEEVKAMKRSLSLVATMTACALLLPTAALAVPAKRAHPDGSIPAQWNLAKPGTRPHPDSAPPSAGGDGSGTNTLPFTSFEDGDMIVTGGTATGHAGEWDSRYYRGSLYDSCVWSANVTPVNGVQREAPRKYRAYDYAWALWVPSLNAAKREEARTYAQAQYGEPYDIASSKTSQTRWYCSKLLWSSYRYTSGLDLDGDGGYWVWPVDLVTDTQTSVFAYAK
jgi:hypothetical protein